MTPLKGFKFVTTLVLVFKKIENEDKKKFDSFYSSSKAEIVINKIDIDDVFQSIYTTVITNMQKSLWKGSGLIMDSVIDHIICIWKYSPLAGSSYIKLPKELDHQTKGLINIENIYDNESFKWSKIRYLIPADRNPARITKADKEFPKKLDFKDIKFPVKIRAITKSKNIILSALVFLVMKIKKNVQYINQKNVVKKSINRRRRKETICSYHKC